MYSQYLEIIWVMSPHSVFTLVDCSDFKWNKPKEYLL